MGNKNRLTIFFQLLLIKVWVRNPSLISAQTRWTWVALPFRYRQYQTAAEYSQGVN